MNISGLAAAKQPQDYLLQVIFLPVTLFLISSSIKTLTTKKKEKISDIIPVGKPVVTVVLFLLLLLLVFVARQTVSQPPEIISPLSSWNTPSITPTPTAAVPQKVTIITENPQIPVNVREKPASSSAILAKIKSGAIFPCLDSKEGWYQIKLKSDRLGWVYGEFVKPDEEKEKE